MDQTRTGALIRALRQQKHLTQRQLADCAGCGGGREPVTVTIWHVYGGETESPLNDLIDTFNETVGRAQNIRVQVGSVTNTNTIHEAVLASAYGEPGATALPDMIFQTETWKV